MGARDGQTRLVSESTVAGNVFLQLAGVILKREFFPLRVS